MLISKNIFNIPTATCGLIQFSDKELAYITKRFDYDETGMKYDQEDFFKRIVLNYLICNGDAHLKNFFLYSKSNSNEYFLTPNYDLLNTRFTRN
jgi:serine/threonine-protein kinase HipA